MKNGLIRELFAGPIDIVGNIMVKLTRFGTY